MYKPKVRSPSLQTPNTATPTLDQRGLFHGGFRSTQTDRWRSVRSNIHPCCPRTLVPVCWNVKKFLYLPGSLYFFLFSWFKVLQLVFESLVKVRNYINTWHLIQFFSEVCPHTESYRHSKSHFARTSRNKISPVPYSHFLGKYIWIIHVCPSEYFIARE